jgi:hypothetical protein
VKMFGSSLPPAVVGGLMSYLRYLCLFEYSLCLFSFVLMPVSLDCPFLIAPSIFSSVYLHLLICSEMYYGMQLSNEKCFTYTKNAQPCANNSDVKRNRVPLV